jgi:hypothetical protein
MGECSYSRQPRCAGHSVSVWGSFSGGHVHPGFRRSGEWARAHGKTLGEHALLEERTRAAGIRHRRGNTPAVETPITPIIIGDGKLTMTSHRELFKEGVLGAGITFPTVPESKARIRTIMTATAYERAGARVRSAEERGDEDGDPAELSLRWLGPWKSPLLAQRLARNEAPARRILPAWTGECARPYVGLFRDDFNCGHRGVVGHWDEFQ